VGKKSGPNPCDRAKSGAKRSTLTEAQGVVVGLAIEGANRHDMKLVRETLDSVPPMIEAKRQQFLESPVPGDWEVEAPQCGLCLDAGYDYEETEEVVAEFGYTAHIRSRGEEKQQKKEGQKARRWVVERTHSWLNRCRRLLVRWDKTTASYLAFLHFASAVLNWNQCLFG